MGTTVQPGLQLSQLTWLHLFFNILPGLLFQALLSILWCFIRQSAIKLFITLLKKLLKKSLKKLVVGLPAINVGNIFLSLFFAVLLYLFGSHVDVINNLYGMWNQ